MRQRTEFPVFMDPAEKHPVGSAEWAGQICARLCHEFERVDAMGIKPFLTTLRAAIPKEPMARPWRHWPPDNPSGDYQAWSQSLFGLTFEKIVAMIGKIDPDAERELLAIIADEQKDIRQGERTDLNARRVVNTKSDHGSTNVPYLLRRIARERPDILAAYERGEYSSARAAARAAGIVKPPDQLKILQRTWEAASLETRAAFEEYIAEWRRRTDV